MFNKIMVCSDGSDDALLAARLAARLARKFHSEVLLVHSYDLSGAYRAFAKGSSTVGPAGDGAVTYANEARADLKQSTGTVFEGSGVKYNTLISEGHPVEVITRLAREHEVDLIVLGHRGIDNSPPVFMGSVSEGVLHHALCNVLIARGEPLDQETPKLGHILLASDGSDGARDATVVATRLARDFSASLSVLNVLSTHPILGGLPPYFVGNLPSDGQAERDLASITDDVELETMDTDVPITFHQQAGSPAEAIVAFADHHETDLIVIGSRGLGTFKSLLLGSVSNRVAHLSRHSVLVTR